MLCSVKNCFRYITLCTGGKYITDVALFQKFNYGITKILTLQYIIYSLLSHRSSTEISWKLVIVNNAHCDLCHIITQCLFSRECVNHMCGSDAQLAPVCELSSSLPQKSLQLQLRLFSSYAAGNSRSTCNNVVFRKPHPSLHRLPAACPEATTTLSIIPYNKHMCSNCIPAPDLIYIDSTRKED
jgi:hypothetical protein